MPTSVAVGLDGSRESLAAADWAAEESLRRGLSLRLVHAWTGLTPTDEEPDLPELAVPRHWARRILRETEARLVLQHPGLPIIAEQIASTPVEAMVAVADAAELLVLGSRGLGGISGFLVGSVAQATVARARHPVVLVRTEAAVGGEVKAGHAPDREVVLGLDPGSECDALIGFAFDAAVRRGATLRVVHAWKSAAVQGDPPEEPHHRTGTEARARCAVVAALRPWREKYPDQRVIERLPAGRPAQHLVEAAAEAALLVVGRRTRRSALGTRIGPVTHAVMHHARCPVVVVPHN